MSREIEVIHGEASATIVLNFSGEQHHRIAFIRSVNKGCGEASMLLKTICEWADATGAVLSLLPVADSGMPLKKLKAWYGRNGFVDYENGMMRRPR